MFREEKSLVKKIEQKKKGVSGMAKKRVLMLFLVFLIVLSFSILAEEITVCSDGCSFTEIQTAINNASSDDIIYVSEGIYDETLNIENKDGISIVGTNQNTTIIKSSTSLDWGCVLGGNYGATRQTMIRVVNSTNIDFSNLTFDFDMMKTSVPDINYVSGVWYWSSTGRIANNVLKNIGILDNVTTVSFQEHTIYVRAMSDYGYNHTNRAKVYILNNEFINTGRTGINSHDYVNINITNNLFYKDSHYDGSEGYDLGYGIELGSESDGVIINNTLFGYEGGEDWSSAGVYVENAFTYDVPISFKKYVVVKDNEIYNSTIGAYLGCLSEWHGDVDIIIDFSNNYIHNNRLGGVKVVDNDMLDGSSLTINARNNIIINNTGYGYHIYSSGDANITFNATDETIMNNNHSMILNEVLGSSVYDIRIIHSKLTNNDYGIYNDLPTKIDATYNYWEGDTISINVDYEPFYLDYTMTTLSSIYNNFIGDTTDFNIVLDITNVENATLETAYGKILWENLIDASGQDFDEYITISNNLISINTSALDSSINTQATLNLYNTNIKNAIILIDGKLCTECTDVINIGGNITFDVSHFTSYSATEDSNLTIWDTSDSRIVWLNNITTFYANYTLYNGTTISEGNCRIKFDDLMDNFSMTYKEGLYQYNRTFNHACTDWTCSKTDTQNCTEVNITSIRQHDFMITCNSNISAFDIDTTDDTTQNQSVTYKGDYSEFIGIISCNYCDSSWDYILGEECVDYGRTKNYYYTNTCCAKTGLEDDCNIPLNINISCGHRPTYITGDVPLIIIDGFGKFGVEIITWTGLIVLIMLCIWGKKYIKH